MGFSIDLSERFLDLVYDAATETGLWSSVLTEICDLTGSKGGVLFGQSTSKVFFDYNGRLDADRIRLYQEQHLSNVWSESMFRQPVGRSDSLELAAGRRPRSVRTAVLQL